MVKFHLKSGAVIVLCALTIGTFALPTPSSNDTSTSSPGSAKLKGTPSGRANSRQLTNSMVPNAGTGNSAGSITANVANGLDILKQQLAATTGNNPLSVSSELQAQAQEAMLLQKLQNQEKVLANVQAQSQQVAAAQTALTTPASLVGKPYSPGNPAYSSVLNNPAAQQTYAQLEAQRQKLALQQQILQQAIRPDAYQQSSMPQIILSQLLNGASTQSSPAAQQIAQQQIAVQPAVLQMSQYPAMLGTRMVGSGTIYDGLYNPGVASIASMNPMFGTSLMGSQITQELLLQQQQQLMLMQQQQLAMLNPYLYG